MIRSVIFLAILLSITACMVKCAWGAECKITWDMPPAAEQITRWEIYRGLDLIASPTTNSATLDLTTQWCSMIAVKAVNVIGKSAPAIIEVVPFVPYFPESESLFGWVSFEKHTIFREKRRCDFARYGHPTFDLP